MTRVEFTNPAMATAPTSDVGGQDISALVRDRPEPPIRRGRIGPWISFGAAGAVLTSAWPVFVFTGSQLAFVMATMASCIVALKLAVTRSAAILGYLLAVIALIGPDANGPLGAGHPWLGTIRIFDATLVAASLGSAWAARQELLRRPSARDWLRRVARDSWMRNCATLGILYAIARWVMVGHPRGGLFNTDARLIGVAVLAAFVAWRGVRGPLRPALIGVVLVGLLVALKAAAIHISGALAIGDYDRLQAASFVSAGQVRTILIGGDTLLILVPATALVLARSHTSKLGRAALAVTGALSLMALSFSNTRTSVLVAVGLVLLVAATMVVTGRIRFGRGAILAVVVGTILVAGVVVASGVGARLTHADAPHVGLNFRTDEIHSFLRRPVSDKLLGDGLAGSFVGKDLQGHPVVAGWAHELPVWLAMKDGVLGLLLATAALAVLVRRAALRWRYHVADDEILIGSAYVLALALMSLTIDRVALVEGLVALVIAVRLIGVPNQRAAT